MPRLTTKCACGGRKFIADITLVLKGVPVWIGVNGTMRYNDTQAEYREGWDTLEESGVRCASCGARYNLDSIGKVAGADRPVYNLVPERTAVAQDEPEG